MKFWPTVLRGVVSSVDIRRRSFATHKGRLIHAIEARFEINSVKVLWRSPKEFHAIDGDDMVVAGYWRGGELYVFAWRNLTQKNEADVVVGILDYFFGGIMLLVPGGLILVMGVGTQIYHLVAISVLGLVSVYGGYSLLIVHGTRCALAELRAHT